MDQIAEKMPDAGGVLVNSELGKSSTGPCRGLVVHALHCARAGKKYNVTSSPGLAKLKASTEKELVCSLASGLHRHHPLSVFRAGIESRVRQRNGQGHTGHRH